MDSMNNLINYDNLFFSFVITWSIGLIPPLFIRHIILNRPIPKLPAFGTCVLFWFINMFIFIQLGSKSKNHGALVLVAIVSYTILRQGAKRFQLNSHPVSNEEYVEHSDINTNPLEIDKNLQCIL